MTVTCSAEEAGDCGRTVDTKTASDEIAKTIFFFTESDLNADAFPKGPTVLDFGVRGLWLLIVPRGVFVFHAIDFDMVIMRGALPRAFGGVRARLEEVLFHGVSWEILVSFDDDGAVAVRNHFSCPRCFRHKRLR